MERGWAEGWEPVRERWGRPVEGAISAPTLTTPVRIGDPSGADLDWLGETLRVVVRLLPPASLLEIGSNSKSKGKGKTFATDPRPAPRYAGAGGTGCTDAR